MTVGDAYKALLHLGKIPPLTMDARRAGGSWALMQRALVKATCIVLTGMRMGIIIRSGLLIRMGMKGSK